MSTGHGGFLSYLLYALVYIACLHVVYRRLGAGPLERRPHPAAVALCLVVAVPSLLQVPWPGIYDALSRQPSLIEHGQAWRLLTSVLVQDGGALGTAYNLVTLALTAAAATALWRPATAVAVFVAGALLFNLPATFLWRDAGGGNSGATFVLVTSTLAALVVRERVRSARAAVVVVAACGAALLVLGDAHGEAVLAGLATGVLVATAVRRRSGPVGTR